jgi:hypothetical protein
MAGQQGPAPALEVGQPFNPFGLFTGIFIPDALVRSTIISPGAKLVYGRLARYAGQDGRCYPAVETLASEVGLGERQVQRYLAELEREHLIRRVIRYAGRAQTSNGFEFLWHEIFQKGVTHLSGEGVSDPSPRPVSHTTPKESQIEESHIEETNCDIDYPPTNRKKRDSRPDATLRPTECKQYPQLRKALAQYMMSGPNDEVVYPSDRQVVDIMDVAAGAGEDDVLRCLAYLRNERGLRPGTRNGPRTFSWFPTVVDDYFSRKRARENVSNPVGFDAWSERNETRLSNAQFDSMTDAIEIDGSNWKP